MRRLAAMAGVLAIAGCGGPGNGPERLPAACSAGPGAVLEALRAAPGSVRVKGTPISGCFNRVASGDDVQMVGTSLLSAAQRLADQARAAPASPAALRLGYLIGAARRGTKRNGLGAELVRRLEQEQGDLPARSEPFRRGVRAGLATG
jgi:hypothetical protein